MQRPPQIECGSRPLRCQGVRRGRHFWYEEQIPHVVGTAWSDGASFGCVFVNHTDAAQRFGFAFAPDEVGLGEREAYAWLTAGDDGWQPVTDLRITSTEGGLWSSNELTLPARQGIALLARPIGNP
jgi:hypothetical protein